MPGTFAFVQGESSRPQDSSALPETPRLAGKAVCYQRVEDNAFHQATIDSLMTCYRIILTGRTYGRGRGVGRGLAGGLDRGVGVGRGVAVAVVLAVAVGVAVGVGVGVGVGVTPATGAWIPTVIGEPVLK